MWLISFPKVPSVYEFNIIFMPDYHRAITGIYVGLSLIKFLERTLVNFEPKYKHFLQKKFKILSAKLKPSWVCLNVYQIGQDKEQFHWQPTDPLFLGSIVVFTLNAFLIVHNQKYFFYVIHWIS